MLEEDGFAISVNKLRPPSEEIDIFNCDLREGHAVRDERIAAFFYEGRSLASEAGVVAHCATVEVGNS